MEKKAIEDYRKKQIKEVTLPSGLIVKVKNISPYAILKAQEEMGIDAGDLEKISATLVENLFKVFLVSPKVPDEITVGDFGKEDYEALQELALEQVIYTEDEEDKKSEKEIKN